MLRVALILTCATLGADAANWPQFRGPEGTGVAPEGKPPVEFGTEKALLWTAELPFGQSSPSIWGNRVFVTSGERNGKELNVYAFDRLTGKQLWRQSLPVERMERTHEVASPASATVLADSERIYVYFGSIGLMCLDHDGKTVWSLKLPLPEKPQGSGTSPVFAGEYVLLSRDDPAGAYLLAIDRKTGKQVWKQSYGAPAMGPGGGNTSTPAITANEAIVHRMGEVAGFDLKTGDRRWSVKLATSGVGSPVIVGDTVFVSGWTNFGEPELRVPLPSWEELVKGDRNGDGAISIEEMPAKLDISRRPEINYPGSQVSLEPKRYFSNIDMDKDGTLKKEEWEKVLGMVNSQQTEHGLVAVKLGGTGDVTASHLLWKHSRNVAEVPTPLVRNGRVYMVTNGGIITCNDTKSGKLLYRGRLGAPGGYFASPIAANGNLYFASGEGIVTVIREGDSLEVLVRNDLGEPIEATPAVVDDTLYVRTAKHLYAFGVSVKP
jgi:outer membrane protein assembly factor BamB